MTLEAGKLIKASDIADDFNNTVRNTINNLIVWKQGTAPGPYSNAANNILFEDINSINLTALKGKLIKKNELTLTLFNIATSYTKVRMVRYHSWMTASYYGRNPQDQPTSGPAIVDESYTNYVTTSLSGNTNPMPVSGWSNMSFSSTINTVNISISAEFMSNLIKSQDIKTLNANIYNAWNSFFNSSSGITMTASYCHSYCHNSCHSSCHHNRY